MSAVMAAKAEGAFTITFSNVSICPDNWSTRTSKVEREITSATEEEDNALAIQEAQQLAALATAKAQRVDEANATAEQQGASPTAGQSVDDEDDTLKAAIAASLADQGGEAADTLADTSYDRIAAAAAQVTMITFAQNGPLGISLEERESGGVVMSSVEPSSRAATVPALAHVTAVNGEDARGMDKAAVMSAVMAAKAEGAFTITFGEVSIRRKYSVSL